MPDSALEIRDLHGWYGELHVLHGVDFTVPGGALVTLLGRNGAGKTTILRAIMGLLDKRSGSIRFAGRDTIRLQPRDIARLGIAYCPEERGIFASLSVEENLMLPPVIRPGGLTRDDVLAMFPNLTERLASQGTKLSGGEQQMLAIGRILRTGARFLLLDEPTEGLAPVIVHDIARTITASSRRASPWCWSSRTSILPQPSPTDTMSLNRDVWWIASPRASCRKMRRSSRPIWVYEKEKCSRQ